MDRDLCRLCRGKLTIQLPLACYMPISRFADGEITQIQQMETKVYPCPECSTPQNKIGIAAVTVQGSEMHNRIFGQKYRETISQMAVDRLLEFIRSENLIGLSMNIDLSCTATLGVVTDSHDNLIERFVEDRVRAAVSAVVDMATEDIRTWGSNHEGNHGRIGKDDSIRFIVDASKRI